MATSKDLSDIIATITVAFKQLVVNLISIGKKGIVLYATKDTTLTGDFAVATFKSGLNLSITNATVKSNVQYMFDKGAKTVILFSYKATLDAVSAQLDKLKFNWIVSDDTASQETVSAYSKEKDVFGLAYSVIANSINVTNCTNPSVVKGGVTIPMVSYLPILAGALAGVPYDKSATSIIFEDLDSVDMPEEMHDGELILYNEDDGVRIAAAVNSLTTLSENVTTDMQEICIVEGMKRLKTDVVTAFKTSYKGHYKNSYDDQCLFFTALRAYIKDLEDLRILDPDYNNTVDVDIAAQRQAWLDDGKSEAETWTDAQVRQHPFKKIIFPYLDVKFLDAIEGMQMTVSMY